jgi:2-polyprenyl-3-methyl-5-hydroxy-6-metoxy-1,4-benzoquinol methylase
VLKDRDDVREQVAFYRAAASAYRRRPVDLSSGALAVAREKLLQLGPLQHILELASGTGDWTQELVRIGQTVTAIDASPEMIEINKQRVGNPRVEYRQEDLFQWSPHQEYDLVFLAFWLSHVPPDLANAFLTKVCTAVRPKGHLFIIDQCNAYDARPEDMSGFLHVSREGIFEERKLSDGRTFRIVKVFYHPRLLAEQVKQRGFDVTTERVGERLFYLSGTRWRPSRSA